MAKTEVEDWCMQMCLSAEADMLTPNVDETEKVGYAHLLSNMNRASNSMVPKPIGPKADINGSRSAIEQERRNRVASEIIDHISKYLPQA